MRLSEGHHRSSKGSGMVIPMATGHTWHVTAVHGRPPMNAPKKQSVRGTPQTPHAMLIPDQGTTPMRRSIDKRTQAGDLGADPAAKSVSPSKAFRVISSARGKNLLRTGARGALRAVAITDPTVVKKVNSKVANRG